MEESEHNESAVRICILGRLAVERGHSSGEQAGAKRLEIALGGDRQRRLLALLVARRGTRLTVDWLGEHIWTQEHRPDNPTASLRVQVSRLRQVLPDGLSDRLQTRDAGYSLDLEPGLVDADVFGQLRTAARAAMDQHDPATAHRLLETALGLWRGDPLVELEDVVEFAGLRAGLVEDHLNAQEELMAAALALGHHTQVAGTLEAHAEDNPFRERAWRQRAIALHRSGRTAEALRVLGRFRDNLVEESGLDPTLEFTELENRLLAGDNTESTTVQALRGYELIERTGSGAFAVVWKGRQPSVNRQVAIKQIHANLASQAAFIRRFEAEAHLVARLEHPHIVPLIDYWRDPTSAYLVMRWLPGGTLEGRLEQGALATSRTVQLAEQIGGALAVAHSADIVHRDVKTANILLDDLGNFFLTDFGIALEAEETTGPEAALSHGTPAYAAPEQLRRLALDQRADIFSLGIVVFECLTGELPFSAAHSPAELLRIQLDETIPRVDARRPGISKAVADVVAMAVERDRQDRFETIEEFVEALQSAASGDLPASGRSERGSSTIVLGEKSNPYRGLRPFDEADRDVFFGRERLISQLVDRFDDDDVPSRGVVLLGPSGSGKSSLARAGLVPALREGQAPGSENWYVATMLPGDDPFVSLELALLRVAVNPPSSLVDQLRDGARGIGRGVRRCLPSDNDELLLVIDQFEELFTLCSADDQRVFLDGLAATIVDPRSQLRVVITLRADVYDRPLQHQRFAALLPDLTVEVPPLGPDELERAIVTPAQRAGVEFEPGLVAAISADTLTQKSALPQLQYLLAELFEGRLGNELTTSVYQELGGMAGALATRAEELYQNGNAAYQDATRRLFGRLAIRHANDRAFRQRLLLGEIASDDDAQRVVEQFAAARLLTFDRDRSTREPTVEVAHESLLEAWPRLMEWLDTDRELLARAELVRGAADTWSSGGRHPEDLLRGPRLESAVQLATQASERLRTSDLAFISASTDSMTELADADRRQLRRLRVLLSVAVVLMVGVVAVGVVAWNQARRADHEADAAHTESARAEDLAQLADRRAEESDVARAEAEQATLISRSISLADENGEIAMLLAAEAYGREPNAASEGALLRALLSQPGVVATVPSPLRPNTCDAVSFVFGDRQYATIDGISYRHDLQSNSLAEVGIPPEPCGGYSLDPTERYQIAFGDRSLYLAPTGTPLTGGIIRENMLTFSYTEAGLPRVLLLSSPGPTSPATAEIIDPVMMTTIAEPRTGLIFPTATVNDEGTLFALGTAFLSAPRGEAAVTVGELQTGTDLFTVSLPSRPASLLFDDASGHLLAGLLDGSIATVDLETQSVISIVSSGTGAEVWSLEVADDGTVLALNGDGVTKISRLSGPLPNGHIAIDDLWWGHLDGGTYAVGHSDGSVTILDLEGGALVSESHGFEGNSRVTFNDGAAIITPLAGGAADWIDLKAGERVGLSLEMQDGSMLNAVGTLPLDGGYVAVDPLGLLGLWSNGVPVAALDLGLGPTEFVSGGESDFETLALMVALADGRTGVRLVDLATLTESSPPIELDERFETLYPARDGGVHIFTTDGDFKTFDEDGQLLAEIPLGLDRAAWVNQDATTQRLAVGGGNGAVVIEPDGKVYSIPDSEQIAGFAWARRGTLLIISGSDGSVRIWDAEEREDRGLIWKGSGSAIGDPWYDEVSDSVWVAADRRLVRLTLDPEAWLAQACSLAGREMSDDEWRRFVPGEEPRQSICS